jgi:hypothetical protein
MIAAAAPPGERFAHVSDHADEFDGTIAFASRGPTSRPSLRRAVGVIRHGLSRV